MKNLIKVFFIGGLTNGRIVYDYLKANKNVNLVGTITYPDDSKCARHIAFEKDENIIKSGTCAGYEQKIRNSQPDLIIVAGWSELISKEILDIPLMGVVGFHPAKLPMDRGRSVLAWQIENGCKETGLTMFRYTDYPDGGDILAQEVIPIRHEDYINDILDKIDDATYNIMRAYFPLLRTGRLVPKKQNLEEGSFHRLRVERDSIINWNKNTIDIYNKIRAISHPYPGALADFDGKRILVWRSEELETLPFGQNEKPGTVVARLYDNSLVYKTRNGFLRITEWETI